VLVGVGFYGAAILLTLLSAALMMWGAKVENRLPSRHAIGIHLRFAPGHRPTEAELVELAASCGYELAAGSITITGGPEQVEWRFVAVVLPHRRAATLPELALLLGGRAEIEHFQLAHARN
jgi:putative Mg2+ transporter-C (MgtC) family protein